MDKIEVSCQDKKVQVVQQYGWYANLNLQFQMRADWLKACL